jgi:hypothetical protein
MLMSTFRSTLSSSGNRIPPVGGTSSTGIDSGEILLVSSTSWAWIKESWSFSIDSAIYYVKREGMYRSR